MSNPFFHDNGAPPADNIKSRVKSAPESAERRNTTSFSYALTISVMDFSSHLQALLILCRGNPRLLFKDFRKIIAAKIQEIELNTYRICIDFEEAEKNTVGTLKRNLPEVLDRINDKLEFVFVAGVSNHKLVAMRTKYIDGDFRTVIIKAQFGNMKGRYLNSEDDEKCKSKDEY